jgi:hypothetical protein
MAATAATVRNLTTDFINMGGNLGACGGNRHEGTGFLGEPTAWRILSAILRKVSF